MLQADRADVIDNLIKLDHNTNNIVLSKAIKNGGGDNLPTWQCRSRQGSRRRAFGPVIGFFFIFGTDPKLQCATLPAFSSVRFACRSTFGSNQLSSMLSF